MKTFLTRSISGFIYSAIIIGSIVAGPLVFGAVMALFLILALYEFQNIINLNGIRLSKVTYYLIPMLVYVTGYLMIISELPIEAVGIILLLLFISQIIQLFFGTEKPLERTGSVLLSFFYLVFPILALSLFFFDQKELDAPRGFLLFSIFAITWMNDTFAYITGSLLGRHKLSETISPKKTWEGSIGGLLFSLAGAYVLYLIFNEISILHWMGLAFVTVIFGTLGDLFESMFKRAANIKESGGIIPGHGGILDRFDSILVAAPFALIYLYFIL